MIIRLGVALAVLAALAATLAMSPRTVNAQPPPDYYAPAEGLKGQALREALHDVIDDHVRVPYSDDVATDAWDVVSEADADPDAPDHVLGVYDNGSWPSASEQNGFWEREHLWPRSYGLGDPDTNCSYAANDAHNLFASDIGFNRSRSNLPFGYCVSQGCNPKLRRRTWHSGQHHYQYESRDQQRSGNRCS